MNTKSYKSHATLFAASYYIDTLIKEDDVGMPVYDDDDKAIEGEDWLDYVKICKYHCFSFVQNSPLRERKRERGRERERESEREGDRKIKRMQISFDC